jgi:lysophospholipase L1-like esterase
LGLIHDLNGVVKHPMRAGEKALAASEEYLSRSSSSGVDVKVELMPDRLHPNPEGYRLWAACIEEALGSFGA